MRRLYHFELVLRHLAATLDADVHLTAGHDLGSVWFEPRSMT
jgi:hypothetical protein